MNLFSKYVDRELWLAMFLWRDLNAKNIELGFRSWGDE